jgi:hypothetical protein
MPKGGLLLEILGLMLRWWVVIGGYCSVKVAIRMRAIRVAMVVSMVVNMVVDIIVGFCMIWVNFLDVGRCNLYYLWHLLLAGTYKDKVVEPS